MKKRRKKNVTVLLVPDDNSEPTNFRISVRRLKILGVFCIFLLMHILTGFVFYYLYLAIHQENKKLITANNQLLEDNKRIYLLDREFRQLEQSQLKIRGALGLDKSETTPAEESTDQMAFQTEQMNYPTPVDTLDQKAIVYKEQSPEQQLAFINQIQSVVHDIATDIPTLLPVEGFLSADFKFDGTKYGREHMGIDIAAKRKSIIRAAGSGIVVFSNWTYDMGNQIIIYHGSGFFTRYAHASHLLKSERAMVKKGDPIALLGSSGISSAPHLHFEIWKDGEAVDPGDYILALQNK